MDDDVALIRHVLHGNVDDFRAIVHRYERPVLRMVVNILRDSQGAEDVAQDVFLSAYRSLRTFDPSRSRFSTWLFTIARNKSLTALGRREYRSLDEVPERAATGNPSAAYDEREFFCLLDRALDGLPPLQKTVFVLAELQGLSHEEIAGVEGVSLGTVKSRLSRAKEKLRAAFRHYQGVRHGVG